MEQTELEMWLKIIGVIISFLAIIIPLYRYILDRSSKLKDARFITYHDLIKHLVEPEDGKNNLMLDRQIAIVFELRNFPDYHELTYRMLLDLKEQWDQPTYKRMIREINYTTRYIEIYQWKIWIIFKMMGLTGFIKIITCFFLKGRMKNRTKATQHS
ncbi:hypothetical protein [Alistipes dispar]|uniref:hypothetical protein n=1 Tax=Alistipes dispar TaxID=2585119 RepID=UPI00248AE4D1|nr:hypothetical protein [Alistipes dispar]